MSAGARIEDLPPADSRQYVLALEIHSADDCPPDFHLPPALARFEAGVFLPRGAPDWFGRAAYPARILLLDGKTLHIRPHPTASEPPLAYALDRIAFVESGHMLLKGWLRLTGHDFDRKIPYNTRSLPAIVWFLRKFRDKLLGRECTTPARDEAGVSLDMKFANSLAAELDSGEQVAALFFQRPDHVPSRRPRIPSGWPTGDLLALTGRRVVWITDRERGSHSRYGSISSYASLGSVKGLEIVPAPGGHLLHVRLAEGLRWEIPVRVESLPSARRFSLAVDNLRGGK